MNKSKMMLIVPTLAVALAGFGQTSITSALSSKASIAGEVRLVTSGGPPMRVKRLPRPISASVPVTLENRRTGKIVLSKSIKTNTKFVLRVAPGAYRISAQIGPPVVNPRPRRCGLPSRVSVHPGKQASVMLVCSVIG